MGAKYLSDSAFFALSDFANELEALGLLLPVEATVDSETELACIARLCADSLALRQPRAVRFDSVRGFDIPVVAGLFSTIENYALALGCSPNRLLWRWLEAMDAPIPPVILAAESGAPIRDVVQIGEEIDLTQLPIPNWTPGRDSGPFLSSACVITTDPETDIQNMGVYRVQLVGPRAVTVGFGSENQHGAIHMRKFRDRGEPCPIALVVGTVPAVMFAAAAKTAYGIDEMDIAGGLQKQSVPVVRGVSCVLRYPAFSEIVIEGFLDPGKDADEKPFGEALGIMSEAGRAPLMRVTAVCLKRKPLMHGYLQQIAPSEGHLVWQMGTLGPLFYYLRQRAGLSTIQDLAIASGSAGLSFLVAQTSSCSPEVKQRILRVLSSIRFGQKFVCLVDEDIDVRDSNSLQFALSSRVDPIADIQVASDSFVYQSDYSIYANMARTPEGQFKSSMALIDATKKAAHPPLALPSLSMIEEVRAKWSRYNLPGLISTEDRISRLIAFE